MTLAVNKLLKFSAVMRPAYKQLVPARLRHVMSCPWILRLHYTSTTRYCFSLMVKCVASICFMWFFSGRGRGEGVNSDCRSSHVVRKLRTDRRHDANEIDRPSEGKQNKRCHILGKRPEKRMLYIKPSFTVLGISK